MYDLITDTLAACEPIDGTEVEFRVPVPDYLFDTVRSYYGRGRTVVHSTSTIRYADATDMRCVDGKWQRKRLVTRVPMPALPRLHLCVAIESPVCAPLEQHDWLEATRSRWTYVSGKWDIVFTRSRRCHNVELEYTGELRDLQQCAQANGDLCGLAAPLNDIVAFLAFTRHSSPLDWVVDCMMPFVRLRRHASRLSWRRREHLGKLMRKCQPVSMTANMKVPIRPLVSAKCDGVRMVLDLCHSRGPNQYGVCRKAKVWHIPCLSTSTMVLDCEYVMSRDEFIVLDVYEIDGEPMRVDYSARLLRLASLTLPTLARASIRVKTMCLPSVLSEAWYHEQQHADGIIVHDGTGMLGEYGKLYKWKPRHTVDLYIGDNNVLEDGNYMPFMPLCDDHGKELRKGEVWEFAFEPDGETLRPLMRRMDKWRANARYVCQEIHRAHMDAVTIDQMRERLLTGVPCRRQPKRLKKYA